MRTNLLRALFVLVIGVMASLPANALADHTVNLAKGGKVTGTVIVADGRGISLKTKDGKTRWIDRNDLSKADQSSLTNWLNGKGVPTGFEKPDFSLKLSTLVGKMAYSESNLAVKPNATVVLTLDNPDELQHNLIVCGSLGNKSGQALAMEALKLGDKGMEKEWIPEHEDVYAASRMVNPKQKQVIFFRAPEKPGAYPYVCTFPGHALLMNGMLNVGSGKKGGLSGLTYKVYKGGNWGNLPKFSELKPVEEGKIASGLVSINVTKVGGVHGIVFEGKLEVPVNGKYTFHISSDDGSRLSIDGKAVTAHPGKHPIGQVHNGSADLKEGTHDIKIEWFEGGGQKGLYAAWSGPGFNKKQLTKEGLGSSGGGGSPSGIPLAAANGEAMIYRNFIEGAGARAIGVGYSEQVSLAFDADNIRIAMMWRGPFIDAKRHWSGRGQGYQPPAAPFVKADPEGQTLGTLASPADAWTNDDARARGKSSKFVAPGKAPSKLRFRGYNLNKKRQPTFKYEYSGVKVSDFPEPIQYGGGFNRHLTFEGKSDAPLYFRAAAGSITVDGNSYEIGDLTLKIDGVKPIVRDGKELLIPVDLSKGKAQFTITYTWL